MCVYVIVQLLLKLTGIGESSVGSLGKDNSYATVEDVRVQNCTFTGTSNGGRIKTFEVRIDEMRLISYM